MYLFLFICLSLSLSVLLVGPLHQQVYMKCKWVLCLTRVKHFMALYTKNCHSDFFLYCSYNIHISPIFLLYNYTFSSYILLYLKQISSYIPIFLSLNVSGRSAHNHLFGQFSGLPLGIIS